MRGIAGRFAWRAAAGTLAAVLALGTLGGGTALAAPFVDFELAIGNSSYGGQANANLAFTVTVTARDGSQKGAENVTAGGDGRWTAPSGLNANIAPGDRFTAKVGEVTVGTLTVPRLIVRPDRVADRVAGRAPAGSSLSIVVTTCPTGDAPDDLCAVGPTAQRTASAKGRWSYDASALAPKGGDRVIVTWAQGGNRVTMPARFPWLLARLGSSRMEGNMTPGGRTTLTLRRSGAIAATARAEGYGTYGYIYTRLRRNGSPVPVRAGDLLTAPIAQDARLRVRAIGALVTVGAQAASGTCLPNGRGLLAWSIGGPSVTVALVADASGDWTATFASAPTAGAIWRITCASPAGDAVTTSGPAAP